jgi:RNA polymerase sigma-70 factor (ECF subfamily)
VSTTPREVLEGLPDEEVVRRVLAGDPAAYAVLVERHQRRIVGFVRRIVRDHETALDVAQETFVKAWQALARYDDHWKFSTWLYSIASNAAIDHLRSRKVRLTSLDQPIEMGDSEMARELPSPDHGPGEIVQAAQMAERLEEAIAQLPAEYRKLLLLRHPGGKSYEEMAAMTRLPIGTVKNRIFRARARLKELLGDILPADVKDDGMR